MSIRFCQTSAVAWFLEQVDEGSLESIAYELRSLENSEVGKVSECFQAEEQRHPMLEHQAQQDRDALPLSRLLRLVSNDCSSCLADALDTASNDFRTQLQFLRALSIHEMLGENCQKNGDLLGLGRSWMWRGRIYSDMHRFEQDLPCYCRALAIFQDLFVRARNDADRRATAFWLAWVQHQLGTKCRRSEDDETALLYLYRAVSVRKSIRSDSAREMSIGNIANCYGRLGRSRLAALNYVRGLALEMAVAKTAAESLQPDYHYESPGLTYGNLASLLLEIGEVGMAREVIRRGLEVAPLRSELHQLGVSALVSENRYEEALRALEEIFAHKAAQLSRLKLWAGQLVLQILAREDPKNQAEQWREALTAYLLTGADLEVVQEKSLKDKIERQLETLGKNDFCGQALLLYAVGRLDESQERARLALASQKELSLAQAESMTKVASQDSQSAAGNRDAKPELRLPPVDLDVLGSGAATAVPAGNTRLPNGETSRVAAFCIDKHLVTNRLFGMYLRATDSAMHPSCFDHPLRSHPDQPVTGVSLKECQAFSAWRSKVTGLRWDVPTLEEWCRAALSDDGRRYPWGNEPPDFTRAVYSIVDDPDAIPAPVGTRPAGACAFGAFDMAGNVWEWTSTQDRSGRWFRMGGSCGNDSACLDLLNQSEHVLNPVKNADYTSPHLGFRCVHR